MRNDSYEKLRIDEENDKEKYKQSRIDAESDNLEYKEFPPIVNFDIQLAKWRKNYNEHHGIYGRCKFEDMPPPLYDSDLEVWISPSKYNDVEINESMLGKYNAVLAEDYLKEAKETLRRHKERKEKHQAWLESDEGKQFLKDLDNW